MSNNSERITGTTKSGFKFSIDKSALDDMEFIEMLSEVDDDPLEIPKVFEKVLGTKQKKALYDHVRTEKGNVPLEAATNELKEIFYLCNAKNS